jgi:hypothetical protein
MWRAFSFQEEPMKKLRKYRTSFRRSDYAFAVLNYRKARRRGDAAEAQRWLRIADTHLRVSDRFDRGVHTGLMSEIEFEEAKVRLAKLEEDILASHESSRAIASLKSLNRRMNDAGLRHAEALATRKLGLTNA